MCGITGVLGPCSREVLERMCGIMTHRGPDDAGYFQDEHVSLAMRRLSIIDLEGGHQPIANEDGSILIVFNGEIYNYQELADLLRSKGHRLQTRSDTETIVHLYEEYGRECVHLLRGMFAFALWDSRERTLLLARDRVGIKPLYYAECGGALVFGSEIKALLEYPGMPREVDREALDSYLTLQYVPGPRTLFSHVRKLPPGHVLVAGPAGICLHQYWDLTYTDAGPPVSEAEMAAELRRLLADAVRTEMIADVPLGALLSGGVDSATVVGLMSQTGSGPVRTFTIGFDDWPSYNELDGAKEIAAHFGADHHPLNASAHDMELLPRLIWHMDEPIADPAALPTYLICKYARERVKVVLTGEGGDELFGGYPRYAWFGVARQLRQSLPHWMRESVLAGVASRLPNRRSKQIADLVFRDRSDIDRHIAWIANFSDAQRRRLYAPPANGFSRETAQESIRERLEASGASDPLHALMYLDFKSWLVDDILVKVDKMSMAASLEARVPLLDHRLIDFAGSIPVHHKVSRLQTKRVLKRSVQDILPAAVFRRRKHAFQVPISEWLRTRGSRQANDLLLSPAATGRGYFEPAYVRWLLDEHGSGRADFGRQVWNLMCLEYWHLVFIDRAIQPAPAGAVH